MYDYFMERSLLTGHTDLHVQIKTQLYWVNLLASARPVAYISLRFMTSATGAPHSYTEGNVAVHGADSDSPDVVGIAQPVSPSFCQCQNSVPHATGAVVHKFPLNVPIVFVLLFDVCINFLFSLCKF